MVGHFGFDSRDVGAVVARPDQRTIEESGPAADVFGSGDPCMRTQAFRRGLPYMRGLP